MLPTDQLPTFTDSVTRGNYNLLLGSGVSLNSENSSGEKMRGAAALAERLCRLAELPASTSLQRAASILTPEQRQKELVDHYTCVSPGPSLRDLPAFLWRRIFTFNIDDAVEVTYEQRSHSKQQAICVNYSSPFEPTPERERVQVVHLHGVVRLPETGFVFSILEYAQVIQDANPWIAMLANTIQTEPFIIAGTSLNEVDVQALMRARTDPSALRPRGPSILIEPNPDRVTRADCERLNLTLVESTADEFFAWLRELIPSPPSYAELLIPDRSSVFGDRIDQATKLRFFNDFYFVSQATVPRPLTPSPFLYGREPSWGDIQAHLDIERAANSALLRDLSTLGVDGAPRVVVLTDDEAVGGSGKTTILRRVAHDLAARGECVFFRAGELRADTRAATACIEACQKRPILVYDNIADFTDEVVSLLDGTVVPFIIVGADRFYRRTHIANVLGPNAWSESTVVPPSRAEYRDLIALYSDYGLIGSSEFLNRPDVAVSRIREDPLAVAVCRILNDFRPLDAIAASLWTDAPQEQLTPFLIAALARHCHHAGLRLGVLNAASPKDVLPSLFDDVAPLSLDLHPDDDDFVVPTSQVVADAVLRHAAEKAPDKMADAFERLANALAPFVNRNAIRRRSAEALVARRLFDLDRVVRPFLANRAELFYAAVHDKWRWNSRYWEQMALMMSESDFDTAIRHARHAVSIERHAYPLTTLGNILLKRMEHRAANRAEDFGEAFQLLTDAIAMEHGNSRVAVHPYVTLFNGTVRYAELGGRLKADQSERLVQLAGDARHRFRRDRSVQQAVDRVERVL